MVPLSDLVRYFVLVGFAVFQVLNRPALPAGSLIRSLFHLLGDFGHIGFVVSQRPLRFAFCLVAAEGRARFSVAAFFGNIEDLAVFC